MEITMLKEEKDDDEKEEDEGTRGVGIRQKFSDQRKV